jgi:hypothetical protein
MPRITYHDRFAALLAKDYVSDRDRAFAESLYSHYKSKGSLTAGRRRCFLQLEERYAVRPEPAAGVDAARTLGEQIQDCDPGSWDARFVDSVRRQLAGGRSLSARQTEIFEKIKAKYTDEAMEERAGWASSWNDEKAERYKIAMSYYQTTGYFGAQVRAYHADPTIVPTLTEYKRVTDNKFIQKIYAGWYEAEKYAAGTMVSLGAGASWSQRQRSPTGLCIVIQANAMMPTSAAKGCKIYKLLPVGGTETFFAEERQLKRARPTKK